VREPILEAFSLIPLLLSAIGIEHALDVPVRRPHDADAGSDGISLRGIHGVLAWHPLAANLTLLILGVRW
jgi:hypothetical protein